MLVVHKAETKKFENSKACVAYEYPLEESEMNGAVIQLKGRYPDSGLVKNLKCKELVYVIQGKGKLMVEENEVLLVEGDMVLILPNEKYFWEGTMTLFISCTPAWTMDQHRHIS